MKSKPFVAVSDMEFPFKCSEATCIFRRKTLWTGSAAQFHLINGHLNASIYKQTNVITVRPIKCCYEIIAISKKNGYAWIFLFSIFCLFGLILEVQKFRRIFFKQINNNNKESLAWGKQATILKTAQCYKWKARSFFACQRQKITGFSITMLFCCCFCTFCQSVELVYFISLLWCIEASVFCAKWVHQQHIKRWKERDR